MTKQLGVYLYMYVYCIVYILYKIQLLKLSKSQYNNEWYNMSNKFK